MRELPQAAADTLATSHTVTTSVGLFYDGMPVLDDVPIVSGTLSVDDTQAVRGSVGLTVPRFITVDDAPVDLLPTSEGSPLGCDGQMLSLTYLIDLPGSQREAVGLGWFRVESWDENDDGTINVAAASLEALIAEARFLAPVTIVAGATYSSGAATLAGGLVPVEVTADPARVAEAQVFEEDRLEALRTLATAWPARMYVDDEGTMQIAPPFNDAADPVAVSLTDGENGTVVVAPRSGQRGIPNAVKASGEATGEVAPVSAVAYLETGLRRWNGPYGNVPYFYSSPLLTTPAAALAAARTLLTRMQVRAEQTTVLCAPDPRIEVGDLIELTSRGRTSLARVSKLTLPLTAAGGVMSLDVTEVAR